MDIYLDTEYIADQFRVTPISIGLVKENGDRYYAVSSEFTEGELTPWLLKNVLPNLNTDQKQSLASIREELKAFIGGEGEGIHRVGIKFWGYFCSYDWVVFSAIMGGIENFPDYIPFYCNELKQEADRLQFSITNIPKSQVKHNALADAERNKRLHEQLKLMERS